MAFVPPCVTIPVCLCREDDPPGAAKGSRRRARFLPVGRPPPGAIERVRKPRSIARQPMEHGSMDFRRPRRPFARRAQASRPPAVPAPDEPGRWVVLWTVLCGVNLGVPLTAGLSVTTQGGRLGMA